MLPLCGPPVVTLPLPDALSAKAAAAASQSAGVVMTVPPVLVQVSEADSTM